MCDILAWLSGKAQWESLLLPYCDVDVLGILRELRKPGVGEIGLVFVQRMMISPSPALETRAQLFEKCVQHWWSKLSVSTKKKLRQPHTTRHFTMASLLTSTEFQSGVVGKSRLGLALDEAMRQFWMKPPETTCARILGQFSRCEEFADLRARETTTIKKLVMLDGDHVVLCKSEDEEERPFSDTPEVFELNSGNKVVLYTTSFLGNASVFEDLSSRWDTHDYGPNYPSLGLKAYGSGLVASTIKYDDLHEGLDEDRWEELKEFYTEKELQDAKIALSVSKLRDGGKSGRDDRVEVLLQIRSFAPKGATARATKTAKLPSASGSTLGQTRNSKASSRTKAKPGKAIKKVKTVARKYTREAGRTGKATTDSASRKVRKTAKATTSSAPQPSPARACSSLRRNVAKAHYKADQLIWRPEKLCIVSESLLVIVLKPCTQAYHTASKRDSEVKRHLEKIPILQWWRIPQKTARRPRCSSAALDECELQLECDRMEAIDGHLILQGDLDWKDRGIIQIYSTASRTLVRTLDAKALRTDLAFHDRYRYTPFKGFAAVRSGPSTLRFAWEETDCILLTEVPLDERGGELNVRKMPDAHIWDSGMADTNDNINCVELFFMSADVLMFITQIEVSMWKLAPIGSDQLPILLWRHSPFSKPKERKVFLMGDGYGGVDQYLGCRPTISCATLSKRYLILAVHRGDWGWSSGEHVADGLLVWDLLGDARRSLEARVQLPPLLPPFCKHVRVPAAPCGTWGVADSLLAESHEVEHGGAAGSLFDPSRGEDVDASADSSTMSSDGDESVANLSALGIEMDRNSERLTEALAEQFVILELPSSVWKCMICPTAA